jgi:hypothetical protein
MFLFFDSQLDYANPVPAAGTLLVQGESNFLHAYGAHAGLELSRKLPAPGLALVGSVEGAGMFGRIKQTFTEEIVGVPEGLTRLQTSVGFPTWGATIGLSYTIPEWNQSRVLIGYQFERWFNIGKLNGSQAELDLQGLFIRAEFNY